MWLCNQKVSNQLLFRISSGCFLDLQKTHGEFLRINLPPLLGCVTGVGGPSLQLGGSQVTHSEVSVEALATSGESSLEDSSTARGCVVGSGWINGDRINGLVHPPRNTNHV